MLPESQQYTLVGLCPEVDWRPLHFVKPLPQHLVCRACGLVRRRTACLTCKHVLCESCYKQCAQSNARICPLDDIHSREEDVEWTDCHSEDLLRREVVCWNEEYGCETVIPASEMSRHFKSECGHHVIFCPYCSARILSKDTCSHLRADCCARRKPADSEGQAQLCFKDNIVHINAFGDIFEKRADEIMPFLQLMAADTTIYQERLKNNFVNMNSAMGTLIEQLDTKRLHVADMIAKDMRYVKLSNEKVQKALTTQNESVLNLLESVERLEKALKDEIANTRNGSRDDVTQARTVFRAYLNKNYAAREITTEAMRQSRLQAMLSNFFVPGFNAFKEQALKTGQADFLSEKVYLCGYCISPGVTLKKKGEVLRLYAALMLYRGYMDECLRWPFGHKVKLSVLHPDEVHKLVLEVEPWPPEKFCKQPTEALNVGFHIDTKFIDVSNLIKNGYAQNDTLWIQWEVLP